MEIYSAIKSIIPDKDGCLNWKWSTGSNGYARLRIGKKKVTVSRYILAKAFNLNYNDHSWEAMHKCNNSSCVNIDHLIVGDSKLNGTHSKISRKLEQEKSMLNSSILRKS